MPQTLCQPRRICTGACKYYNSNRKLKRSQSKNDRLSKELDQAKADANKAYKSAERARLELHRVCQEARASVVCVRQELQEDIKLIEERHAEEMEGVRMEAEAARVEAADSLQRMMDTQDELDTLLVRLEELQRTNNMLRMRDARAPQRLQNAVTSAMTFHLKLRGIITTDTREMIRDFAALGVPAAKINEAIHIATKGAGITTLGDVDRQSVAQIVLEGLIATEIQLVQEMHNTEAISLSGDATTDKHLTYESKHACIRVPKYSPGVQPVTPVLGECMPSQHFLGINHAVDHTSEVQLEEWINGAKRMHETYNTSPAGKRQPRDWRNFARLVKAMNTDHANDQKKLFRLFTEFKKNCEAEMRGEEAFESSESLADIYPILWEEINRVIEEAGGEQVWDTLEPDERQRWECEAYKRACVRIGKERMDAMTPEEIRSILFCLWGGCCMHKALNGVKGGVAGMTAYWKSRGLPGPIKLANKDQKIGVASGNSVTAEKIEASLQGGAAKLTSLAGAVFTHKDKKKGQQDTLQVHMEVEFGYRERFPDTTNNRYHSHSDVAAELVTRHTFYCRFPEPTRDLKDGQKWTNIEQNVWDGLHDTAMLPELHALALDGQTCLKPFLRSVRAATQISSNLCDLGPLLRGMCAQYRRFIADPGLALSPGASYETGTLDRKPWDRPDVVYVVQSMASSLPDLEGVFVAYCEGAVKVWERFTTEFAPGGAIDSASTIERLQAFMMPTNDDNEGALGQMQRGRRHAPNMTIEQHNARRMYCKNDTRAFMRACFGEEEHGHLRKEGRARNKGSIAASHRQKQAAHDKSVQRHKNEKAADRVAEKIAADAEFAEVKVRTDVEDIRSNPGRRAELDKQLNYHRRLDPEIPKKKYTPNRPEKIAALIAAVERYNEREAATKAASQ
ncbi:hypothetical protein BOTBODRAFT_116269 [Botryobasidium botryosum FD-172 SS1]|uniref:Uncharacterized protein n=1 Tax=Botryobasidium botryosum (strain FD-172 SS1) TaxID=930990 RepID=A0A067M604_BOTB1|nr:hypothetical protein BOTBODRAFT_116269 [Botryobasidium botryosum FD-172 SS1]